MALFSRLFSKSNSRTRRTHVLRSFSSLFLALEKSEVRKQCPPLFLASSPKTVGCLGYVLCSAAASSKTHLGQIYSSVVAALSEIENHRDNKGCLVLPRAFFFHNSKLVNNGDMFGLLACIEMARRARRCPSPALVLAPKFPAEEIMGLRLFLPKSSSEHAWIRLCAFLRKQMRRAPTSCVALLCASLDRNK